MKIGLSLLMMGLLGCSFKNDPRTISQEYFTLLYSFRFDALKPIARGAGLMEAAYFQGRISEMSDEEKVRFLDPQITIESIDMISKKEAQVKVTITFVSGTANQFTLSIRKHGYRWVVSSVEPSLVSGEIYVY